MQRSSWRRPAVVAAVAISAIALLLQLGGPSGGGMIKADASGGARDLTSFDGLGVRGRLAAGDRPIAPAPESFDAPAEPEEAPPAALNQFAGVVPSGGTWAVIIGINDYPGARHDLRSAVNDANDMSIALSRMGVPGDHQLVLRDRQASARSMRLATDWLRAHAGPDAVAVFFYAGHVRKTDGREAMVAADGSLMSDAELAAKLDGLRARRAWIGIAACYGGGFTEVLKPGRVLTGASPANKLAYENSAFGRSYMVEYMVRQAMIENLAPETIQISFAWARDAISRDYPGREPVQFDQGTGILDLRPPGAPAARRATTKAASPTRSPSGGSSGGGGTSSGGGGTPPPATPPPTTCVVNALGVRICG